MQVLSESLLKILYETGGIRPDPSLTERLEQLVADGLIYLDATEPSAGGPQYRLTPKGIALAESLFGRTGNAGARHAA